jgi:protein-tyrosine-phosphatase/predicted ATP-grasp superfamily ATP-dependent carboligase
MTSPATGEVLVLAYGREMAALPIIRSLGRRGVPVTLGFVMPHSLARESRYLHRQLGMPDPIYNVRRWVEWLKQHLAENRYDAVFPAGDSTIVPLHYSRKEFSSSPPILMANEGEYELSYNKLNTIEAAIRFGVPVPATVELHHESEMEAVLGKKLNFPLILKPYTSKMVKDNRVVFLSVAAVEGESDFREKAKWLLRHGPVLVQDVCRGHEVGQEFLLKEGEVVAECQHERIHEQFGGGMGCYRCTAHMDPVLRERSLSLLRTVSWSGVATVEYLTEGRQPPVLMEINGRFWGSLPLQIAAGVDYPWLWLQMVKGNALPPQGAYPAPIYSRNLERDLAWIRKNLRTRRSGPLVRRVSAWKIATEILHVFAGREHFDELTLDDPRPGLRLLSSLRQRAWRKAALALLRLPMMNGWYVKRSARRLKKAGRIVVLCTGNTCRSPFLAEYLRQRAAQLSLSLPSVRSRGFLQLDGTPSSALAVQAAQPFAVDLSAHAAKGLCHEKPENGDVYVLVEPGHAEELSAWHGRPRPKVIYWGLLDAKLRSAVIPDPDQSDLDTYRRVYEQIQRASERILREIRRIEGK